TPDGKWFTMRVQPYRTVENTIEGAVILFVDITEIVQVRERLAKANALARLAVVVRDANDAITVQDLTGRMIAWNPSAEALYGWSEAEALAMNVTERTPDDERVHAMERLAQLARAEILEPYRTNRRTKRGDVIPVTITSTALVDAAGQIYAIATTERAIKSRTESL
ncbi:MAG: PAS domain S-box protein, partial [Acidobacteriota bacterium]